MEYLNTKAVEYNKSGKADEECVEYTTTEYPQQPGMGERFGGSGGSPDLWICKNCGFANHYKNHNCQQCMAELFTTYRDQSCIYIYIYIYIYI